MAHKIREILSVIDSDDNLTSDTDSDDDPSEKESKPWNAYKTLLTSLSGGRRDHAYWISCLNEYLWRGKGNFSYTRDESGIPYFKNDNNSLNLCVECIDRHLKPEKEWDYKFLWEGNYWAENVHDYGELTLEAVSTVINKCANILKNFGVSKGTSVLLYLPKVIQLPIAVFACARIGAVFTIVDSSNTNVTELARIFEMIDSEIIITVDGFWMGEELKSSKLILDMAIEKFYSETTLRIPKVLMIRHTGPNPAIPEPTKEYVGRRPWYQLNVPFIEGRDFHWSKLMINASAECEPEWLKAEDIVFKVVTKIQDVGWQIQPYNLGHTALLVKMLAKQLELGSRSPVWPIILSGDLLFVASLFAVSLTNAPLLLFEGSLEHPDPSRISMIIQKYKVEKLIITEDYVEYLINNPNYVKIWDISSLKLVYTCFNDKDFSEKCKKVIRKQLDRVKVVQFFV